MRVICIKPFLLMLIPVVFLTACGTGHKQTTLEEAKPAAYLTIKDDAGRITNLAKKPERIVVLSTSFLDLLYAVDGKAVGRPSSKTSAIPKEAQDVTEVGYVYNLNIEKITALQPDLVIAVQGMHEKLIPGLENSNIPVIVLNFKTYDDIKEKIKLFGDIAGTQAKAKAVTQDMDIKIKNIIDKVPAQHAKVAILHATAKDVCVELENSVAGSMAKMLKVVNVAAGIVPINSGADTIPYSLEKLTESDPDIILIVTMGAKNGIDKRMQSDIESNPAWSTLRAVRNKRVVFLPSELFLLNPGLKIPDAIGYMAKVVYPDSYGE